MSDIWAGPGYWLASDGKWYAPELHPSRTQPLPPDPSEASPSEPQREPAPENGATSSRSRFLGPGAYNAQWATTELRTVTPGVNPYADLYSVEPPKATRGRRFNRRLLAWAVAPLVAVVAVVAILVVISGQGTRWDPKVIGIVHFVEQHRGLTFKHPVKVEFLSNAQFDQEVVVPAPTSTSDKAALGQSLSELRALGLVHGNVNLAASENKLNQADIVGLYVNSKKTVFVRGTKLTPYVRVTLAHELTHALQDQYFNLTKLQENATGDGDALTSLIEGDAVRVQNLYEQALSPSDQKAYQKAQNQFQQGPGTAANVPQILSDIASFPYAFGPTFVDSLDAQGGTAGINRAFHNPPVAEAQIVDPAAYPLGWKPVRVKAPALTRGERRLDKPSSFGQVSLFEILGNRLGYDKAWAAVQGWQGDNSLPYKSHGRTCVAIDVAMGGAASAARLTVTARQWAQALPSARVTQSGKIVALRSCDPGSETSLAPAVNPSAFDVLAARAEIIDGFITSDHADFPLGACIADRVLAGVGPSGYGELTASSVSPGERSQLQQLVVDSVSGCEAAGVK